MRLIEADYVKSKMNKEALGGHLHYYVCGVIDDAPTIDTEPVKHGHWIDRGLLEEYPRPDLEVYHLLRCSECGAFHRVRPHCEGGWINASYCANCGAKMDGDDTT